MPSHSLDDLAEAFRACTLPKAEWTHEAHLRVGLWFLLRHSPDDALDLLRDGIRSYNVACGVANTETSGYNETITRFYVRLIARFLDESDRSRPPDELARMLLALHGGKRLPLKYWSGPLLMSGRARAAWVEPDLQPLP